MIEKYRMKKYRLKQDVGGIPAGTVGRDREEFSRQFTAECTREYGYWLTFQHEEEMYQVKVWESQPPDAYGFIEEVIEEVGEAEELGNNYPI